MVSWSHSQWGWSFFNKVLDGRNHALREPEQWKFNTLPRIYRAVYLNNTSCSHHCKVLWPCTSPVDQLVYTVTQMANAVFYYPGEWACFVCSWLLVLTFFSHWLLRVQVSHHLFLLIVYCALVWHSSWVDRKQQPNDTGKILPMNYPGNNAASLQLMAYTYVCNGNSRQSDDPLCSRIAWKQCMME